jgi:CheY-like chemotaxis protein
MNRRQDDRLRRLGHDRRDRRQPAAELRRVLLVGTDEAWRLLATYVFEEAGYVVYAAATEGQAVAFTSRLLPDVVVMQVDAPNPVDLVARLAGASNTRDIPVVVLTPSLHSRHAHRARAAGAVPMLPHAADFEALVGEVDTLIAVGPRVRRTLKRRLLDLQELARYYTPNEEGRASLRRLIDHLQIAIFAVDEQGQCIAASEGVTTLTGYSRLQLLTTSLFETAFGCKADFVGNRHDAGPTTITTRGGEDVMVHAAAMAEILPGIHVAAFAAA